MNITRVNLIKTACRFLEAHGEEAISIFALSVMSCSVFLQVISRYIFSKSIPWAEEVAVYGMVWAVYMGAAAAVRERAHLRITNAILMLPRAVTIVTIAIADLLWIAFNVLMVIQSSAYMKLLWERTYISPSLGIDQKWPQMCVAIGFGLMTVRILQIYYNWYRGGFKELPL